MDKLVQITMTGPLVDDSETLAELVIAMSKDLATGDREGTVTMMAVDGSGSCFYDWSVQPAPAD